MVEEAAEVEGDPADVTVLDADGDDDDEGAELMRRPSVNTLRGRRLERLSGGGATQLEGRQQMAAVARPVVSPVA